ncbi:MAG: sigma-54 dependent transcriptional regulator [Deltaproteobacteria bacterium]|jgi:two-component system response regulator HydG|nr:sigma-54 dependent transcriptional regulator [Deltaproteobacteria bacterium]
MEKLSVLLVDDDMDFRTAYGLIFKDWGYELTMAKDGFEAVKQATKKRFDLILMDVKMDGLDGLQALKFIKKNQRVEEIASLKGDSVNTQTPIIMLTGYATVKDAVQAMKDGAYDFLIKGDIGIDILKLKIDNVIDHFKLKEAKEAGLIGEQNIIVGKSPAFRKVLELVERIAPSMANVLLTGESGVGKEVVARLIWSKSDRANQVFATCNCSAVSKETVEDSLFGHRKGAFTGATSDRQGILKSAEGGTVFLDEIGETTPQFQTKLLRALQEREIQPLGSDEVEKVDVRFLAATNVELEKEIESGNFRKDIFHRFTFQIRLPSLRERLEDLPELANYYLGRYAMRNGRAVSGFTPKAMEILLSHSWPGNIRELQNAMEYVVVMMTSEQVTEDDLPEFVIAGARANALRKAQVPSSGLTSLKESEKISIINAMESANGIKLKAAKALGISRKTLGEKIKRYQLTQYLASKDDDSSDDDDHAAGFDGDETGEYTTNNIRH